MALQEFPDLSKSCTLDDGTTYAYVTVKASDPSKPTFLFLHGHPSSSYDWRYQINSLKDSGYGLIVPDLLGYGDTDKPLNVEAYRSKRMAGHIAELLEKENIEKVVGVGHDWGAFFLGRFANHHPNKLSAAIFISVAYMRPGPFDLTAINGLTEQLFGYPIYGYFPFLNEDGTGDFADRHLESLTSLGYTSDYDLWKTDFCPIGALQKWLEADKRAPMISQMGGQEYETHLRIMKQTGFNSQFNWYKVAARGLNDADDAQLPVSSHTISVPTLFILSDRDATMPPAVGQQTAAEGKKEGFLPDIEVKIVEGIGHWIQLERADECTSLIETFGVEAWSKSNL